MEFVVIFEDKRKVKEYLSSSLSNLFTILLFNSNTFLYWKIFSVGKSPDALDSRMTALVAWIVATPWNILDIYQYWHQLWYIYILFWPSILSIGIY